MGRKIFTTYIDDDEGILIPRAQVGSRLADLMAVFNTTVTKTTKDGSRSFTYAAALVGADRYMAIEVADYYEVVGEGPLDTRVENVAWINELQILNGEGEWAGPSVHIYQPEIDGWTGDLHVQPTRASHSSFSGAKTPNDFRATATMLNWAANYAEAQDDRLIPLAAPQMQKMREHRAAQERKWAEDSARDEARMLNLVDEGNTVRVTMTGKNTPVVGVLQNVNVKNSRFEVKVAYSDKPVVVQLSKLVKFETKLTSTGRFDEVPV